MKILTTHRPGGAWAYITDAWINAFTACGHVIQRWDGHQSSWNAFSPDLYIGCSGHPQPINWARGKTKLAIHVNPFGSVSIKGIDENQETIKYVKSQRPDAVFGYGHKTDIRYWDKWVSELCPWVPMPTAGDATRYFTRGIEQDIQVGYVGGRWNYKARNLDAYLLPLFNRVSCHVHGWGGWPAQLGMSVFKGPIDESHVPTFFSRCKICPCVVEPHTTQYGIDLPERTFKVILSGALAIHDPVFGLNRYVPSIVMAQNPAQFLELCEHWLNPSRDEERKALAEKQRKEVLAEHTYFHRLAGLLVAVGFKSESDQMLNHAGSLH